jgi:GNAT superfamily N-acetyltransferase
VNDRSASALIRIRPAEGADAALLADFNAAMALETEGRTLDAATVRRGVEIGLSRPDYCRYHLAELEGRVVGQLMITWEWSDWRAGMFWWIQSVYVVPGARGRGVFKALYRHVESMARGDGECRGLRLYVERHNASAQAAYARLGMRDAGYGVFEVDWS